MRVTLEDWRRSARRRLPRFVFDYLDGAAEDERCMRRNVEAFQRYSLLPEVMQDVSACSTRTSLFGIGQSTPLVVAPIGLAGLFWGKGDLELARVAAAAGIPYALSTAGSASIEQVAAVNPGTKWFQLYVLSERRISEALMGRAAAAGYKALILTVDTVVGGNRERDVRNGFRLPFRYTPRVIADLLMHPRWLAQVALHGSPQFANIEVPGGASDTQTKAALISRTLDRSLTWQGLEWIKSHWQGPLLIKGVLCAEDAVRARDAGADGVIVSNHGGRQLDAAPATLEMLPDIVQRVGPQWPVLIDSGFRRGTDVVKALALGAHAVLIGRPLLYGLAAAGGAGAAATLRNLVQEIERTLSLLGVDDIRKLSAQHLRSERV